MEEINAIHESALEWGCITKLIDRIIDIEGGIEGHWDALNDMLCDIMEEEGKANDPAEVFFSIYQYVFRLYYRLKVNPTKRAFDIVEKTETGFRVLNYSYKTYKWAVAMGSIMTISNDYIDLPMEKLTIHQRRAFDRRCGQERK